MAACRRLECDDVPQVGQRSAHFQQLVQQRLGGRERDRGAGVAQDVFHLSRGQRGIHRDVGGAEGQGGVVHDGPFGPVFRQDGDPVAALHPEAGQGEAGGADALEELLEGDGCPAGPRRLPAHRDRPVAIARDRAEEKLVERAGWGG